MAGVVRIVMFMIARALGFVIVVAVAGAIRMRIDTDMVM
jgi:hypothetical protein